MADSTGGLSWNPTTNALTVSCWFKFSIPSGVSISQNMVILANRNTGSWTGGQTGTLNENHAYAIYFNAATGAVEFSTKGTGGVYSKALIDRPYLERWYHVAVVRSGPLVEGFVDGRRVFNDPLTVANSQSTDGLSIGGLGGGNYLRGEVIEAQVFQRTLVQGVITENRFKDLVPSDFAELRGYFKLAFHSEAANQLKNFAVSPPPGTGTASVSGSGIAFEETNREGEQSLFDSTKNSGADAVSALSGAFTWQHTVFSRSTPGIPFSFEIGYNSANGFQQYPLEDANPYEPTALGNGWRHSFETRLLPYSAFSPDSEVTSVGLMLWDGNIETWDLKPTGQPGGVEAYQTRHKEYRGELREVGNIVSSSGELHWITPDRLVYVFRSPFAASGSTLMRGRLKEVRDFNGNRLVVEHHLTGGNAGQVSRVLDTGGGIWTFDYNAQNLLTSVSGPSQGAASKWTVNFTYTTANGKNVLYQKSITAPAVYSSVSSTTWEFRYESRGLLERIIFPRFAGTNTASAEIEYDSFGRKTLERDEGGRETTYQYNKPALRQLTTVEPYPANPAQERKTIDTYDRKLRPIRHQDAEGFETTFGYDEAGNPIETTDARGNVTRMTYDARSNLLSTTNPLGETTRWEYNHILVDGTLLNEPTREIRPATAEATGGWENVYEYDSAGNLRFHHDGPVGGPRFGTLAEHAYNSRGLVTSSWDANRNETRFSYDPVTGFQTSRTVAAGAPEAATWTTPARTELGWPLTETNPLNQSVRFEYNVNGQVVKTTDAIGRIFLKTYNANGSLLTETDGKGRTTSYQYTRDEQIEVKTDRKGQQWRTNYNHFGEVDNTVSPPAISDGTLRQETVFFVYDRKGRLIRTTDPYGKSATIEYDANDNKTAEVDKLGRRWEKSYDSLNRVFAERDPEGNVRRTSYDAAGRIRVVESPNGDPSFHEYNGRGRLKKWTDPEGFSWIYTYDGVGNILDIEDALGGHYVMTYGPRNERLTERNQSGKQWTYVYDEIARLKVQTNPPGTGAGPGGGAVVRTLFYDAAGRIDYVQFNTGRINDLTYDNNNNVTTLSRVDGSGPTTLSLAYDELDRLVTSIDAFSQTVGYGYDALNRVVTKTYPGGRTLTHEYDRLGRLKKLSFPAAGGGAHDCTFTYDDAGRLTNRSYPNGISQMNTFDTAGRLTDIDYAGTANPPIALDYAYDQNGNKTGGNESGTLGWKQDSLADYDETATFHPDGSPDSRSDALSPRDFQFQSDDAGNLTGATAPGEEYTFTYDEDNRTTGITWDLGLTRKEIANRYDGLGRRVARTLDGVETRYVLDLAGDMERILCDTNANGVIQAWYVHGPDLCFRVAANGTLTCYHADGMGNVVRTTDATGATRNQYAYTPYGREIPVAGAVPDGDDPYRFVGSQGVMLELPGLYFMRARYYSAEGGVFLATDPLLTLGAGLHINSYSYGDSNPISSSDPTGLRTPEQTAKIERLIERQQADTAAIFAQLDSDFWNAEIEMKQALSDSIDAIDGIVTGDLIGTTVGMGRQITGLIQQRNLGDGAMARRGIDKIDKVVRFSQPFINAQKAVKNIGTLERSASTLVSNGSSGGMRAVAKYINTSSSQLQKGLTAPIKAGAGKMAEKIGTSSYSLFSSSSLKSNGAASAGNYANSTNSSIPKTGGVTTVSKINKPEAAGSKGSLIGKVVSKAKSFFKSIFSKKK